MKPVAVALLVGTLIGSVLTGLTYLSSADASGATGGSVQVAAATPAAAVVAPVPVYIGELTEDADPIPENVDPVLGTDHWGTRSDKVKGAKGQVVTGDLHANVENFEDALLTEQQADELLEIFEDARGVRRLIRKYDGDPCDDTTKYWVRQIHADEDDAAPNTPWVTATLRADFDSPEGRRGIEMKVYRRKTDTNELDNTPYVAETQISYLESDPGGLSIIPGYRHSEGEDWAVVHDTLETIYYEN